ncbi:MAG: RDD family protein, partial [Chitinophagaceae bacterium]|nr:RDD family protein [Rubrivivax sp.]
MTAGPSTPSENVAPGLMRRLACFVYEGVLLFGVVMLAGLLYGVLTDQRHALVGSTGLQVFVFLVLGLYFVWFWSRHGQTLAMRTWHLRV